MCTGGSPFSMLSGARRGEQKGSLTTGELCILISASCSERSGSKPRGNSLGCSSSDPSSTAGGGMATEDKSLDMEGSLSLQRKKLTSSTYRGEQNIFIPFWSDSSEVIEKLKRVCIFKFFFCKQTALCPCENRNALAECLSPGWKIWFQGEKDYLRSHINIGYFFLGQNCN